MTAYIQQISTSVPDHAYRQEDLRDTIIERIAKSDLQRRVIHKIYSRSGINTRYSVLADFRAEGDRELYNHGSNASPGTGERNRFYEEKGRELFVKTAQKLVGGDSSIPPGDITHLLTISCTGFYAPGPDYDIIRSLGLHPEIERYNLGFMGCYAVIPGLKLAYQICSFNPEARVMVIANELCTLHFQNGASRDELVSGSLFADGAAGTIVSGAKPKTGPYFKINGFASTITNEGSEDMAWSIGDTGFHMILSSYVPEILTRNLDHFLDSVLGRYDLSREQINRWAIHPGGRAILDRLESQLDLPGDPLKYSRHVLANYGNMSSATIFFVLKMILDEEQPAGDLNILAMAFGPGLTIETGLLEKFSA